MVLEQNKKISIRITHLGEIPPEQNKAGKCNRKRRRVDIDVMIAEQRHPEREDVLEMKDIRRIDGITAIKENSIKMIIGANVQENRDGIRQRALCIRNDRSRDNGVGTTAGRADHTKDTDLYFADRSPDTAKIISMDGQAAGSTAGASDRVEIK